MARDFRRKLGDLNAQFSLTGLGSGLYDLDFNAAFNPYCVYDVNYTCPLPPAENRLQVAIRAGERMPESHR